jgi:hypothetical protein
VFPIIDREKLNNSTIWLSIDPIKVKQRIEAIAARLEGVLRKCQMENDDSGENEN